MSQPDWDKNAVTQVIDSLKDIPGAMLPILHGIQDTLGYIPKGCVPMIANALNVSRAEVHGVITFYHYYRDTPPGKHTIHLCRAESCQSMNGIELETHAKAKLGIDYHETTSDGDFSLEPVYCLGNCGCSPAISIDGEVYGRVSPERFDEILDDVRAQA
ncbi:MAG: formate dehydrogenase subunit gamma [Candidatus Methylumidiphilus sp.]